MARYFAHSILVIAFVIGLVGIGGPQPADAIQACGSGKANTADVAVSQSASQTSASGSLVVTYLITVTNLGPCQAPTLDLTDDLPSLTSSWVIVATTPGSWINGCPTTSGSGSGSFSCFFNAGLGATGSGSVALQVSYATGTPADTTNHATISLLPDGVNCDASTGFCQTGPDNDQSWGALLVGNTQLKDGTAGTPQFSALFGPGSAVSAAVAHKSGVGCQGPGGTICPLGGRISSIKIIDPTTGLPYFSTSAPLTFVFYFSQATYGKKPSQITIQHTLTSGPFAGTYSLTNCKGNNLPPWGCVSSRSTVTIGGVTYSVITVTTPQNDDWFGW